MTTDNVNESAKVETAGEIKTRLLMLLITETPHLTQKYAKLIGYVGGLLSTSMIVAYAKGLSDAAKLINQETTK